MKNKNIYLVAKYYMKPRTGVNTSRAGWMDNPDNIQYDESVDIVRGLKSSQSAQVILNLTTKTVEKNSWNERKDFDALFAYFFEGYHSYLTSVMKQLDPEYLSSMVNRMYSEVEASPETPPEQEQT